MNIKALSLSFATTLLALTASPADFNTSLTNLVPRLADANLASRYPAQMELQSLVANASRPGHESERAEIATLLAKNAGDASVPQPARAWIVRQLEYIGGKESVAALEKLLAGADAELRDAARRALEKNSSPTASAALRTALAGTTDPALRVGLLNSLAIRMDTGSVKLIATLLTDKMAGDAAARALGAIASPAAIKALQSAPDSAGVQEALISAATALFHRGDKAAARAAARKLATTAYPVPTRAAALHLLVLADDKNSAKLIEEALNGGDHRLELAALNAIVALGSKGQGILAELLPRLNSPGQARALTIVNADAEAGVLKLAASTEANVRITAIQTLGRMGTAAAVPLLVKLTGGKDGAESEAAGKSLVSIQGNDVSAAIEKAAAADSAALNPVLLRAMGDRNQRTALPLFLTAASRTDGEIRKAALEAIGKTGADAEIESLTRLVLRTASEHAAMALVAVADRVTDKPAAAKKILAIESTNESAMVLLSGALAALGGPDALDAVTKLASSQNAEVREAGINALAESSDFAAVKPLLAIAADAGTTPQHRATAIDGVVRLVKSAETAPKSARAEAALAALVLSSSTREKRLVLSAIASVPDAGAVSAVKPLLSDPEVKREAALAMVGIAEVVAEKDSNLAKELAQAVKAADVNRVTNARADRILAR